MFKEFKAFIMRGNVLDLAVAVIIGGAFGTIVNSLVKDIFMPPVGLILGRVNFSDAKIVFSISRRPLGLRTKFSPHGYLLILEILCVFCAFAVKCYQ